MNNLILTTITAFTLAASVSSAHPFEKCPNLAGSYNGVEDGQQPAEGPNKFEDSFPVKIRVVQNATQLQVTVTEKGNGSVKQSDAYALNRTTTSELDSSIRTDSASCFGDQIVVTSTYTQKPNSTVDPNLPSVSSKVYEKTAADGLRFSEVTVRPKVVFNRILFISK